MNNAVLVRTVPFFRTLFGSSEKYSFHLIQRPVKGSLFFSQGRREVLRGETWEQQQRRREHLAPSHRFPFEAVLRVNFVNKKGFPGYSLGNSFFPATST